jgi:pimeloyl-ACP methyl ester carboxylesterase
MNIKPFTVSLRPAVLDDLRERLENTRWPDEVSGAGWDYGTNLGFMRSLIDYWHEDFDWPAQERALNAFPHFLAEIDGHDIHFIHQRGRGPKPMPIILTHGWPSSCVEMLKLIPLLADPGAHGGDPADAFDVVAPSLPGFGFSTARTERGLAPTHPIWRRLMVDGLGYARFAAQGGDVGARVTSALGRAYPDNLIGLHLSTVDLDWPAPMPAESELSEAERDYLERVRHWEAANGGYSHILATRPQTLAYGLNDSPAGLAAWIVEKWREWSDCEGDLDNSFTRDELLTNITLYWATQSINASMRYYYEKRHDPEPAQLMLVERIQTPTAVAVFPAEKELLVPREWAERSYNIQRWTEMPRGGHFAALEEPELLADDIRAFFRGLRE